MPDKNVSKKEPNIKDQSEKEKYSQKELDDMRELRLKVKQDDDDRQTWKAKMVVATNQRLGVKRYTNFPYPGAPDIPLPETDKLIKKSIPTFVLSAWSPKKMVSVRVSDGVEDTPEWTAKATKAERVMNFILRHKKLDWFNKLCIAADNFKQYGHCIFKTYEQFCSHTVNRIIDVDRLDQDLVKELKAMSKEQLREFVAAQYFLDLEDEDDLKTIDDAIKQFKSGEKIIEMEIEVVYSLPQVDIIPPTKIIVPAYTTDINKAPRICFETFKTKAELQSLMDDRIYLDKDLETKEVPQGSDDSMLEEQKNYNEGIRNSPGAKDLYRIHEICFLHKEKGQHLCRRVLTFLAEVSDPEQALLQDIDFPYEYEGWFYDKHDNEKKDDRYFSSRGVPEQIRALQEISERCINNMIIRDEMNNTPIYEVLSTSDIMDSATYMTPGQKLAVGAIGTEIKQLNQANSVDASGERMMQMLKAYAEEYLNSPDQLFRNATNAGGGKTKGEVQMGMQANQGPLSLEVIAWNDTLSKVYSKMFKILRERLGTSIVIEGEEVTKEDFNFPAEIRSNGDLEISDEQMSIQKSANRIQILTNPIFQSLVSEEDKYNLLHDWLEKDGVRNPDEFITRPEEIAQNQIAQMQQQIQQLQQALGAGQEELTKDQKDSTKAKRMTKKYMAQGEAIKESADQELGRMVGTGSKMLGDQINASEELTGRTVDQLIGQ